MVAEPSASDFLAQLRVSGLLDTARLDELTDLPEADSANAAPLARVVLQRGWLTQFQLDAVRAGKGRSLLVGPYLLLDRLASDAAGWTFTARHRPSRRTVTLKLRRKTRAAARRPARGKRSNRLLIALGGGLGVVLVLAVALWAVMARTNDSPAASHSPVNQSVKMQAEESRLDSEPKRESSQETVKWPQDPTRPLLSDPPPVIPPPELVKPSLEPVPPAILVGDGRQVIAGPGLNAAAYCLGGTHLVVTSHRDGVLIIDARSGQERRRFGPPVIEGESRGCLAVSADGRRALVAHADRVPRLWDLETGEVVHQFVDHKEQVRAVALSDDGRFALSAGGRPDGRDVAVRVWDVQTGKLRRRLEGHQKDVWQLAVSPDGRRAAAVGWDHLPRLWDLESGTLLHTFENLKAPIARSVRFAPDGKTLLFGCLYGLAVRCDAETGKELQRYAGHRSWVWEAAFTPDGRLVVTTAGYDNKKGDAFEVDDGAVRVFDAATGKLQATLKGHRRIPGHLALSSDGRRAVSTDHGGTVLEWDLTAGRP